MFKSKFIKTNLSVIKKYFSNLPPTNDSIISYNLISTNKDIGLLTIKNASKRNALSLDILNALINELNKIEMLSQEKKNPRVVILASEGGVFSSGHDLKELKNSNKEKQNQIFKSCADLMMKIEKSPSIFISEVQGLATAAGCQLAATCDLVVASSKAKFETPGVRIGLFCSSPSVALARVISQKRAMHMLVTGSQISALTALNWGLVNEIVDVDKIDNEDKQRETLRESTLKLAEHINQYSGETLSYGKKVFYSQVKKTELSDAYKVGTEAMCTNICFDDTQEGISAFLQKRKPIFNKTKDTENVI